MTPSPGNDDGSAVTAAGPPREEEGRVGRGCAELQAAVAEWLILSRAELLIRSRKSSFSDEAALAHGVKCVELG